VSVSLEHLQTFKPTGNIQKDITKFFMLHNQQAKARHTASVVDTIKKIAIRLSADISKAEVAAWLHDIGEVIPNEQRLELALANQIRVLPEEEKAPMLIHQKLSRLFAKEIFGIHDIEILNVIECHTTLKANPTSLEKLLFVADKIAWVEKGERLYLDDLYKALEHSLDEATLVYLDYIWQQRETLTALHPWAVEARISLLERSA
jgi:predicted HD superfamily hydrolase involved in NAD metabolism